MDVTPGGIVLPDTSKTVSQRASVVAVGPKVEALAAGQLVLFAPFSGGTIKDAALEDADGEMRLLLVREEDVIAVID